MIFQILPYFLQTLFAYVSTNMFTCSKIILRQSLKNLVVANINESLIYQYVPPVLGLWYMKERYFSSWSARRPSKEFPPDNHLTEEKKDTNKSKQEELNKTSSQYIKKNQSPAEKPVHFFENKEYMVLDENDYTFSNLMIQVGSRNSRRKSSLMMLEGKRLNQDALLAGFQPIKLFFTQKSSLSELDFPNDSKIPLFKIPYKTMKLWSKLEAPPGVVGFFRIPKEGDIKAEDSLPVRVLCDNVREPGNLGSILRVAASVGCNEVLLMTGCTDPWDSKVLRSASGGHFHIPIRMDLSWEEHEEFLQPAERIFLADNNYDLSIPSQQNLPQLLYHELDYVSAESIMVIIGGETEGVSDEARSLALTQDGSRVYIPLSNSMESLNSGCALSVLLFEIKRQFLVSQNSFYGASNSNEPRSEGFG